MSRDKRKRNSLPPAQALELQRQLVHSAVSRFGLERRQRAGPFVCREDKTQNEETRSRKEPGRCAHTFIYTHIETQEIALTFLEEKRKDSKKTRRQASRLYPRGQHSITSNSGCGSGTGGLLRPKGGVRCCAATTVVGAPEVCMPRPSGHPLLAPSYGIQTEKTTTRRSGHDHRTIDDGVCTCTDISRKQQ